MNGRSLFAGATVWRRRASPDGKYAYKLGWSAVLVAAPLACIILLASGMSITPVSAVGLLVIVTALIGVHLVYGRYHPSMLKSGSRMVRA